MVSANGSTASCRDWLDLAEQQEDDDDDEDGSDNSHPAMSKTVAIASKAPVIAAEQYEQDDHDKDDPKQRHATISYFCVCAGAVALGVVVTDIDTLP